VQPLGKVPAQSHSGKAGILLPRKIASHLAKQIPEIEKQIGPGLKTKGKIQKQHFPAKTLPYLIVVVPAEKIGTGSGPGVI
jgi:hypothetical protein